MNKWLKILLSLFALGILVAAFGWWYVHRPAKGAGERDADFTLSTQQIIKEFKDSSTTADKKYQGKNIQLSGKVSSIEKGEQNSVSVFFKDGDFLITCSFSGEDAKAVQDLKEGSPLTLKGLYKNFSKDDLMGEMQVAFNPCSVVK